ncbi:TonB-dependent receptor domain-containing protein [Massilia sp. DWR3-1-1]|uniref:TonB-dependent receptor domain-containing protein n=1 Tax=Massilia sp. DWR3-1-1 TaxID=2804559 RepID=UPI003CEE0EEF
MNATVCRTSRTTICLAVLALAHGIAQAQQAEAPAAPAAAADSGPMQQVAVTGTRIRAAALTATSPVSQYSAADIAIGRAITVEDFSVKVPQLAGGVNGTSAGSDGFGAQTLDLRNLGQSRTLVLINGTRAVPFGFRNAVDVNFIPAPLLKRVDVLTGGAAAVYGADAIAGVVNFIINDRFDGLQASTNYRTGADGGAQKGVNVTGGTALGEKGHIVGYLELTRRDGLMAGDRDFARVKPTLRPGAGGNFVDVASGRAFSYTDGGQLSSTKQTTDYTPDYTLIQPLKRFNASSFFTYELSEGVEAYGRAMFSRTNTTGAPTTGQAPPVLSGVFAINQNNPYIPAAVRNQLTFVNGVARVQVDRSLGELGVITIDNKRDTYQLQAGLRGPLTSHINWDVYVQSGRSSESLIVNGDASKAGAAALVNATNIFGPGADVSSIARPFDYGDRVRKQVVTAATLSGDSSDVFKLPAGPLGFAVGAEARRETGEFSYSPSLAQSFNQATVAGPAAPPSFRAKEIYAEVLVPVLRNLPLIHNLSVEGAVRRSFYSKSLGGDNAYTTDKLGASWAVDEQLRLRATKQSVIREPNMGEYANPVFSLPFNALVTTARLQPRYQGDPCALGTGDKAQCARFGAPAAGSYNSLDPALLTGGYYYGGNPAIRAEKGDTRTLGLVLTPAFAKGLSITVDYYDIKLKDAVGQVQPVDALTSCYITDPRADNPLCQAVTRDPATGRIKDAYPVDRNLAEIRQSGFDVDASYRQNVPFGLPGKKLNWGYQAAIVKSYTIQKNPVLDPIDCKGTYGFRCSSDAVSLVAPAYRHRATLAWDFDKVTAQLGWKRVGKVKDSTVGSKESIAAQDYFELNFAFRPAIAGLTVNVGIDNLFDKQPPTPTNASIFNTYPDTYNVLGRAIGFSVNYKL